MSDLVRILKALSDPTRLRLYSLLDAEELSVHELREITRLGQSRISAHLQILEQAGLVRSRREGKQRFYRAVTPDGVVTGVAAYALQAARTLPEYQSDRENLKRTIAVRNDPSRAYFQRLAGRFGRKYGPGRSWQALAQALLRMLPAYDVADLGAGEGLISEMLAMRCRRVIAVDNSPRMVAYCRRKARRRGICNIEYRLGDLQEPPIEDQEVDIALLSQSLHHAHDPEQALRHAFRILRPGGRVIILDLMRHENERAQELYGDLWPGFTPAELERWLQQAGFEQIEVSIVAREEEPPFFETILAVGRRPA